MKSKIAFIILIVMCLLLGVALLITHNDAVKEKEVDTKKILDFSNSVVRTEGLLTEQKSVNSTLETNLLAKTEEAKALTTNLATTTASLEDTKKTLEQTRTEAKAASEAAAASAQAAAAAAARTLKETREAAEATEKSLKDEVAKRESQIAALNINQEDLTRKIGSLNTSITSLNGQIARTEKELENTKGDKEFLLKELKRLQSEKSDLEKQMNDLAFLREQIKHLKEEISISRRLDWMRRGLWGDWDKKGGQLMQDGFRSTAVKTNAPGTKLNVELKRDGTVTITPATNAPPKTAKPK